MFVCLFFFLFVIFFGGGVYLMVFSGIFLEFCISLGYFFDFSYVFQLDYVSCFFFSCVSLISSMVFLYSKFYMEDSLLFPSLDNSRFFYLVFLFVVSMFFLVFSGSWVVVLLGWDGLGIISFLLVIYFSDTSTINSGLITFLTNRIGDSFFIISFMFFFFFGWVVMDSLSIYCTLYFFFLLFVGCVTKSSQIPFSSWLPAAMAAPTPVSSLVHSSTLVTAGVYLLIRFNFLFLDYFFFLSVISLLTMFLAGGCAMYEKDFKKIVAMSTLSQLGFMIFSISMGFTILSLMHMIFHAFFKSSLFLTTGNLMHYLAGGQDSRMFGSMGSSYISKVIFCVSCMSLMGFPFSLGFYSKDSILGSCSYQYYTFFFVIFFVSCVFTVGYSARLISSSFFYFPSFSGSISFKDFLFFFVSVFLLYFFCVFLGNFFFFFFSSPVILGVMDSFLGVLIIMLGVLTFYYSSFSYHTASHLSSIGFLTNLVQVLSPLPVKSPIYTNDTSWSETFGVSLLFGVSNLLSYMNILFFFSLSFYIFVTFYFLFFF